LVKGEREREPTHTTALQPPTSIIYKLGAGLPGLHDGDRRGLD
jgi:hypothetical protein